MNKWTVILLVCFEAASVALGYTVSFPTAPAAGEPGSTAVYMNDASLSGWADGYTNLVYGANVDSQWQMPANGLGAAQGSSSDIVCLGRGGQITLSFSQGIADGSGFDFAVFENAISDTFLELAWVEVSSDGIHFVRFPDFSDTPGPVGSFDDVYPYQIYGYGGKYRQGYGTPFDLAELHAVSNSIAAGGHALTAAYVADFTANMPYLDTSDVRYVRLIDVVGDGTALDCEGYIIYDPYPTSGSAGFDLDAVGVINQPAPDGLPQQITFNVIPHQKISFGSAELAAAADSGLPVAFSIQSGPAVVTNNTLYFTGTGTVEVVANQSGNEVYAPAAPVLQAFTIAEEIQHIFVEPIPNQLQGGATVQVNGYSSQGLPVQMEIFSGPPSVSVGLTNHVVDLGNETGGVILRAYQPGNATTAPASDVYMDFEIVDAAAPNAPVAFVDWMASNGVPSLVCQFSEDVYGRPAAMLGFEFDMRVAARCSVWQSADLISWTNAVPEIIVQDADGDILNLTVHMPAVHSNRFFRLLFEEQ